MTKAHTASVRIHWADHESSATAAKNARSASNKASWGSASECRVA
jgi:hypothetical protein